MTSVEGTGRRGHDRRPSSAATNWRSSLLERSRDLAAPPGLEPGKRPSRPVNKRAHFTHHSMTSQRSHSDWM